MGELINQKISDYKKYKSCANLVYADLDDLHTNPPGPKADDKTEQRPQISYQMSQISYRLSVIEIVEIRRSE